jgi:hypothetical protein
MGSKRFRRVDDSLPVANISESGYVSGFLAVYLIWQI